MHASELFSKAEISTAASRFDSAWLYLLRRSVNEETSVLEITALTDADTAFSWCEKRVFYEKTRCVDSDLSAAHHGAFGLRGQSGKAIASAIPLCGRGKRFKTA